MTQHILPRIVDPSDLELPPTQPIDITHFCTVRSGDGGSAL
jgi:hypothetical protein